MMPEVKEKLSLFEILFKKGKKPKTTEEILQIEKNILEKQIVTLTDERKEFEIQALALLRLREAMDNQDIGWSYELEGNDYKMYVVYNHIIGSSQGCRRYTITIKVHPEEKYMGKCYVTIPKDYIDNPLFADILNKELDGHFWKINGKFMERVFQYRKHNCDDMYREADTYLVNKCEKAISIYEELLQSSKTKIETEEKANA